MTILLVIVFLLGYLAIAFEHKLHINKAATALALGTICWTIYSIDIQSNIPVNSNVSASLPNELEKLESSYSHLTGEIASILFFLMGAMTIVELVDANEGFSVITNQIKTRSKRTLFIIVATLSFWLSSVLDNLTTTIVMISLLRKLVADRQDRLIFVGMVVIAANAGGAWTVIGDVTTTMLWIKHRIDATSVMQQLFLASLVCFLVPLCAFLYQLNGELSTKEGKNASHLEGANANRMLFLSIGLIGLISVPIFKHFTHLPPYMGMIFALAVLWIVSEFADPNKDESTTSETGVLAALTRVDMSSILFFLGILLAVGALAANGLLAKSAAWLDANAPSHSFVAIIIGLVSAVVDNVPLVAAGIEMYQMPMNDPFWMLLAYCAGTGGSCLIIGSAAGVAAMGMEKIDFIWYLKRIAPYALLGYGAGVVTFFLQSRIMN